MSSLFWAEELGVSVELAERVSWFMDFIKGVRAIEHASPWAKNGFTRVYVELWSQNSIHPCKGMGKVYYDAEKDDFLFINDFTGETKCVKNIMHYPKSFFSGAKTRTALIEMCEAYYAKKIS